MKCRAEASGGSGLLHARKDAGDRGSAAGSGHVSRAQVMAAAGLRDEAAPTVGGSRLSCSGDQGCGGSAGSELGSHRRAAGLRAREGLTAGGSEECEGCGMKMSRGPLFIK